MRYWISALLLASAMTTPALAQDNPYGGDHGRGGGPRGADHGQRPPQPQQMQRPQQAAPQQRPGDNGRQPGWQGGGGPQGRPQWSGDHPGPDRSDWRNVRPDQARPGWNGQRPGTAHPDWSNGRPSGDRPGWNGQRPDQGRPGWNGDRGRPGGGDWRRDWRQDRRYDWQSWRQSNREVYRVGRYRPPYGQPWGYRRFSIGYRIAPVFFAQDYWIDNPAYYRLPPAYGPYRWVRYYNDALLIDLEDGEVVDMIPDFFW